MVYGYHTNTATQLHDAVTPNLYVKSVTVGQMLQKVKKESFSHFHYCLKYFSIWLKMKLD